MNPEEEASNAAESRGDRIDQASADFINESVSDLEPSRATDTIKIDAALDGDRLRGMPKEIGVMLVSVGALGVVLPGIVGVPAVVAGGLILWPKAFGKVDGWLEKRFPKSRRDGLKQIGRFIDDFEKRFPDERS